MKQFISFPKQRSVIMRTAFKTMPTIPMDLLLKGKHDIADPDQVHVPVDQGL